MAACKQCDQSITRNIQPNALALALALERENKHHCFSHYRDVNKLFNLETTVCMGVK